MDETGVADRQGHRDPGADHGPLTGRDDDIGRGHQVGAGVTRMGVGRQRHPWVDPGQQHLDAGHGRRDYPDPVTDSASTAATGAEATVGDREPGAPAFRERLYLPWYHWLLPLLAAGLLAAEVNMGYPGVRAWLPYLVTVPLTLLLLWRFSAAKVEVHDGELWVGEAHLPLEFAGETQIIPANLKRKVLGPAFDILLSDLLTFLFLEPSERSTEYS